MAPGIKLGSQSSMHPGDAQATVTETPAQRDQVDKVIVAVHGVGDQHCFVTIQAVANRFCSLYKLPAGIPLGSFHGTGPAYLFREPIASNTLVGKTAFAEVYWARMPRALVEDRYTLEEARRWAKTRSLNG